MNKTAPSYILTFMLAVCIVFGTGISIVHYATAPLLRKNLALHRNRTLAKAFMLDVSGRTAEDYEQAVTDSLRHREITAGERTWQVYIREGAGESPVGFQFTGMGFWDRITGVVVLDGNLEEILNLAILEQKETPGLGGRIEEKEFRAQFRGLKIAWDKPPDRHIVVGASRDPDATNRVDAITGATQTSMALMNMLNSDLAAFREVYEERIE